ncbi:MAG: hypothetical protein DM484_14775 [Candidatus Methylumidiphilus alinenensis]|uniref:Uncharacterized protein n=1 Tax=Candidatus Methylumidiphilus alinenensis TaxID=2202197 RepID=A0A2W4T477_9GAMM|nr:MAG: hypothetical protein DM484_14775 [Candidatus Methylumidiphilus alinenensis]
MYALEGTHSVPYLGCLSSLGVQTNLHECWAKNDKYIPVIPAGIAGQIGRIADLHGSAAQRVRDMDVPNAFSFQTFWGLSKGMASFSLRWAL